MKSVLIPVLLKYLLPAGDLSIRKNLWMLNLSSTSWRCIYFAHLNEGNGTPLQYSCLENCMDGGAWWAAVHGVAKSQTRLSDFTFTFTFPVFLPGKFHGQRSLVGYSPWGRKELDMTERLNNEANSFVNVQVPTYHPALTVLTFYQSCSSTRWGRSVSNVQTIPLLKNSTVS